MAETVALPSLGTNANDLDIAPVQRVGQSVAVAGSILVAVRSRELQLLAVEEESFLRVDGEPAESERIFDPADEILTPVDFGRDAVEIGCRGRPERRPGHRREQHVERSRDARRDGERRRPLGDRDTLGVDHPVHDAHADGGARGVRDGAEDANGRALRVHARRLNENARRGVIGHRDVDRIGRDEPDVAVDPAIEREIAVPWRDVWVMCVIHPDRDDVLPIELHELRHVDDERRIPADVPPGRPAVYPDVRDLIHTFEIEEETLRTERRIQVQLLAVPADAPTIPRRVVERVVSIPRMGNIERFPGPVVVARALGPRYVPRGTAPLIIDREPDTPRGRLGGRQRRGGERENQKASQHPARLRSEAVRPAPARADRDPEARSDLARTG